MLRQQDDIDQQQQHADTAPGSPTVDSDGQGGLLVTAPPMDKTLFGSWAEFHEFLAEYQKRTYQVYSTRTVTQVTTRNRRITERYAGTGQTPPPGELLPEEMGIYSKAYVCTHHGQPRPKATGQRTRKPSRAINCPARITMLLRKDHSSGSYFVHVTSHTARHNHELSGGDYRRHPKIRKITDADILRTVRVLQKANAQPRKILEYVREHTDKELVMRDVHNLLASMRKNPPPTTVAPTTASPQPSSQPTAGQPESSPHFAGSALAAPPGGAAAPRPTVTGSAERPLQFVIRNAAHTRPQPQTQPPPPPAAAKEQSTQYGKFLAAFNIGKEVAEVMAEMDDDRFANCYAELRMFLRVVESGRIPVVTTRDAMDYVQNNNATGSLNLQQ
ncbi:Histone H4 [Phytophthora cinnamomi]|uniref:Histone H4 n=1 Tax=Phytophthora cinnamomi TaxID=4785 RepID=UPI003559D361|nr:Histone H4 [Phytophthora cinnamomi]